MKSTEFDPKRPIASAMEVLREVFLRPRAFYQHFEVEGSWREPATFVLFVSAVSGSLWSLLVLTISADGPGEASVVVFGTLAYVVLSPVLIGLFSGAYLLSVRGFVVTEGSFRGIYRILAYAWGAMVLFPFLNALAFTYATLVLMVIGIGYVYRAPFLTALVTALVAYVPSAIIFILIMGFVASFATG
jgi:hypothetical protein